MENIRKYDQKIETMAWGALFAWWGVLELLKSLPNGIDAIGVGMIFLGANAARSLSGVPTRPLTSVIGVLALLWGVLDLANAALRLPFQLPVFAILLLALGIILLSGGLLRTRNA